MGEDTFKSLASWKCWWHEGSTALHVAEALVKNVDPKELPRGSLVELKNNKKVSEEDFHKSVNCKIMEGLLSAYPSEKDPSAYLLGDAVLRVDQSRGHVILGKPALNPMVEKTRCDSALKEGQKLKLLLSYIRNSSGRHEKGRKPEVTFLKEMVLSRPRPRQKSRSFSPSPTASTRSDATTLMLPGLSPTPSPQTSSSSTDPPGRPLDGISSKHVRIILHMYTWVYIDSLEVAFLKYNVLHSTGIWKVPLRLQHILRPDIIWVSLVFTDH